MHLIAVYRDLESLGCAEDVCCAGMFHSIYGTEKFQGFTLPLEGRGEVRALVGERAERLAYLNCAVDRASRSQALDRADGTSYPILDRITGEEIELSRHDFDDLCRVHLIDWLEQVQSRMSGTIAGQAIERWPSGLGGSAALSYRRVFGPADNER